MRAGEPRQPLREVTDARVALRDPSVGARGSALDRLVPLTRFVTVAARLMRMLVDYAPRHRALRRGGTRQQLSFKSLVARDWAKAEGWLYPGLRPHVD